MKNRVKLSVTALIITMTTLTGCGLGNMVFHFSNSGSSDAYDVESPELSNKYLERPENKSPKDLETENVLDNLFIAAGVLKNTIYWSSESRGKVVASVGPIPYNQEVYSKRIINNDENKECFFQTNTISAFVKKSEQRFVNSNSYLNRQGSNPSLEGATYTKDNIIAYSKHDYLEQYGNFSNGLCNYVLNDYSVSEGYFVSENDGLYTFKYILNPEYASAKYVREVKYMSGSNEYPIFSKNEIEIVIDDNWQLKSIVTNDVYTIGILGGLTCSSELVDEYSYTDSYQTIPEKEDFKTKFGMIDEGDVKVEKTATEYLTDAAEPFLAGDGTPINIQGDLSVNGSKVPLYVSCDLTNNEIKLSLDDAISIFYKDEKAYLLCGDKLNFVVNKDEVESLIKHYNADFSVAGMDLSTLLDSDVVKGLMENMVMDKDGNNLTISLSSDGIVIDMHLVVDENDKASFDYIELSYDKDGNKISGNIELFTSAHKYQNIPSDLHEFTNLNGFATSIDEFINNKAIEGKADFKLADNVKITGDYKIDFNNSESIHGYASLFLNLNDEEIPFGLTFVGNDILLSLGTNVFRMNDEQLKDLLFNVITKSGLDLGESLDSISNLKLDLTKLKTEFVPKLNSLIKDIETNSENLSVSLDLVEYKISEDLTIKYNLKNSKFDVELGQIGSLNLIPSTKFDLSIEDQDYLAFENLNSLVNMGMDFVSAKKFVADFSYSQDNLSLFGSAKFDLAKMKIQGDIDFTYNNVSGSASFYYENDKAFLTIADSVKACLTKDEAIDLIDKLKKLLEDNGVDFNQGSLDISVNEIINSLTFEENSAYLTLPFANASVEMKTLENKVIILGDGLNASIALKRNLTFDFDTSGEFIDGEALNKMISEIDEIVQGYKNCNFDFAASINNKNIVGHGTLVIEGDNISLNLDFDKFSLSLIYEDSVYYLNLNGAKIKGTLNSIILFADAFLEANNVEIPLVDMILDMAKDHKYDLGALLKEALNLLPKNKVVNLEEMIQEFKYQQDQLSICLKVDDKNILLNWNLENNVLGVEYSNISFNFNYNQENEFIHATDSESYLDACGLDNLKTSTILNFANVMSSKILSLNGNLTLTIAGKKLDVVISKGYLDYEEGLVGEFLIELIDGDSASLISVKIKDNNIYLNISDNLYFADSSDNFLALFNGEEKKVDISNIFAQFNNIFKSIEADENGFSLNFDLSSLEIDILKNGKIAFDDNSSSLSLELADLGTLSLIKGQKQDVTVEEKDYKTIEDVTSVIEGIKGVINSKKYQIDFEGTYDKYAFSGSMVVDLNDKFDLAIKDLSIYSDDFNVMANVYKIGDMFYIDLGNVKFALTISELISLIQDIEVKFGLDFKDFDFVTLEEGINLLSAGKIKEGLDNLKGLFKFEENNISLDSLNFADLINGLRFSSSLNLNADLSNISSLLGVADITLNNQGFGITTNGLIKNITLQKSDEDIANIELDDSWYGKDEISRIVDSLSDVVNFLKKKTFSLSANGSVRSSESVLFTYEAKVKLNIEDTSNIKLEAVATVIDVQNNLSYNVSLTMVDGVIYGVYNSNLKFYISMQEALQLVRYVIDIMGIKSDLLSNILDSVTEGIDTGVFAPSIPEMKPLGININDFLRSFASDDKLRLVLDAEKMYEGLSNFNPNLDAEGNRIENSTNSYIDVAISTLKDMIDNISINNIYANKDQIFDINIDFDDIYHEGDSLTILAPESTNGYFDFNSLTVLIKTFFNSANIKSYSLTANLALDLVGYKLGGLPIEINIELDENMKPFVSVYVDVKEDVAALGGMIVAVRKGKIYIYYDGTNQTIYLKRYSEYWFKKNTEYRQYTIDELSSDSKKLVDFIYTTIYCSDIIKTAISSAIEGGNNSFELCDPIYFENVLTKYSYSADADYNYSLLINGPAIVKNNLDEIDLKLGYLVSKYEEDSKEVSYEYLDRIALSTTMMSAFGIELTDGKLTNVKEGQKPSEVKVVFPDFTQEKW